MKKSYSIILIVILIISGYTAGGLPNNDYDKKNIHFNFSNINIIETNDFISLKLEGTNSVLVKKDHYIIPI